MYNVDYIRSGIEKLYRTNPNIHISVCRTHPKIMVALSPARIIGVYRNIFQIEECTEGQLPAHHTFQYGDVLIGQVTIAELNFTPAVSVLNRK